MTKQKIKLTSIPLGGMNYFEPVIGGREYLTQAYNIDLLSQRPSSLPEIQKHIAEAEQSLTQARNMPELLEIRYYFYCALKRFDTAVSALLVLITHKYHLHRPSELQIVMSIPADPEFMLMEDLQRRRSATIKDIIENLLSLIEVYLQNKLVYSTDIFFEEIHLFGSQPIFEERLHDLKERVAKAKIE